MFDAPSPTIPSLPAPRLWASVLACDLGQVRNDVQSIDEAGIDAFHIDVMDGHFVPNVSFGLGVAAAVRAATTKPVDAHLMATCLDVLIPQAQPLGLTFVHIHHEASAHLHRWLNVIRASKIGASVALNPQTAVDTITPLLAFCDAVLVMTVNPGFGGQTLIQGMEHKVTALRAAGFKGAIMVDGGVDPHTIGSLRRAGATDFVVGSAVYRDRAFARNVAALREALAHADADAKAGA